MLGYYVLAANLASWPVTLFSQPLRSVAPALFARLRHDPARMRGDLLRVLRPVSLAALPAVRRSRGHRARTSCGSSTATRGRPPPEALRWLALLAGVRILAELAYDYLVVVGRSRALLMIQCVWIVVLVPAVWLGVERGGIGGAAAALAVVGVDGRPVAVRARAAARRRRGARLGSCRPTRGPARGSSGGGRDRCHRVSVWTPSRPWPAAAPG